MPNGKMGAVMPAALTPTVLYTSPAATIATVTLSACNQATSQDTIRVAICSGGVGTLTSADYIEYGSLSGVLERTGISLFNGQTIIVYSTTGTTSFVAYGLEG